MSLKRLLLATTSLCALSLVPLAAHAQDAALTAAYEAYVAASSGTDADAKMAAETAFLIECAVSVSRHSTSALVSSPAVLRLNRPMAPESAAVEPTVSAAPAEDASSALPAAEAPADSGAQQPSAETAATPVTDPALTAAYEAYVTASSGNDDAAKAKAEAAFLAECNRLGIASLAECLALFSATGEVSAALAVDAGGQPVEVIPNQEATDAEVAPVLDSAKEADGEPAAEQPVGEQPRRRQLTPKHKRKPPRVPEAEVTAVVEAEGKPIETLAIEPPQDMQIVTRTEDNRFVFNLGLQLTIFTPYDDRDRIVREGDKVSYEELDNGRVRQIVTRADGTKVVTVGIATGRSSAA